MSRQRRPPETAPLRFPRVSGDEPDDSAAIYYVTLFSPRERG